MDTFVSEVVMVDLVFWDSCCVIGFGPVVVCPNPPSQSDSAFYVRTDCDKEKGVAHNAGNREELAKLVDSCENSKRAGFIEIQVKHYSFEDDALTEITKETYSCGEVEEKVGRNTENEVALEDMRCQLGGLFMNNSTELSHSCDLSPASLAEYQVNVTDNLNPDSKSNSVSNGLLSTPFDSLSDDVFETESQTEARRELLMFALHRTKGNSDLSAGNKATDTSTGIQHSVRNSSVETKGKTSEDEKSDNSDRLQVNDEVLDQLAEGEIYRKLNENVSLSLESFSTDLTGSSESGSYLLLSETEVDRKEEIMIVRKSDSFEHKNKNEEQVDEKRNGAFAIEGNNDGLIRGEIDTDTILEKLEKISSDNNADLVDGNKITTVGFKAESDFIVDNFVETKYEHEIGCKGDMFAVQEHVKDNDCVNHYNATDTEYIIAGGICTEKEELYVESKSIAGERKTDETMIESKDENLRPGKVDLDIYNPVEPVITSSEGMSVSVDLEICVRVDLGSARDECDLFSASQSNNDNKLLVLERAPSKEYSFSAFTRMYNEKGQQELMEPECTSQNALKKESAEKIAKQIVEKVLMASQRMVAETTDKAISERTGHLMELTNRTEKTENDFIDIIAETTNDQNERQLFLNDFLKETSAVNIEEPKLEGGNPAQEEEYSDVTDKCLIKQNIQQHAEIAHAQEQEPCDAEDKRQIDQSEQQQEIADVVQMQEEGKSNVEDINRVELSEQYKAIADVVDVQEEEKLDVIDKCSHKQSEEQQEVASISQEIEEEKFYNGDKSQIKQSEHQQEIASIVQTQEESICDVDNKYQLEQSEQQQEKANIVLVQDEEKTEVEDKSQIEQSNQQKEVAEIVQTEKEKETDVGDKSQLEQSDQQPKIDCTVQAQEENACNFEDPSQIEQNVQREEVCDILQELQEVKDEFDDKDKVEQIDRQQKEDGIVQAQEEENTDVGNKSLLEQSKEQQEVATIVKVQEDANSGDKSTLEQNMPQQEIADIGLAQGVEIKPEKGEQQQEIVDIIQAQEEENTDIKDKNKLDKGKQKRDIAYIVQAQEENPCDVEDQHSEHQQEAADVVKTQRHEKSDVKEESNTKQNEQQQGIEDIVQVKMLEETVEDKNQIKQNEQHISRVEKEENRGDGDKSPFEQNEEQQEVPGIVQAQDEEKSEVEDICQQNEHLLEIASVVQAQEKNKCYVYNKYKLEQSEQQQGEADNVQVQEKEETDVEDKSKIEENQNLASIVQAQDEEKSDVGDQCQVDQQQEEDAIAKSQEDEKTDVEDKKRLEQNVQQPEKADSVKAQENKKTDVKDLSQVEQSDQQQEVLDILGGEEENSDIGDKSPLEQIEEQQTVTCIVKPLEEEKFDVNNKCRLKQSDQQQDLDYTLHTKGEEYTIVEDKSKVEKNEQQQNKDQRVKKQEEEKSCLDEKSHIEKHDKQQELHDITQSQENGDVEDKSRLEQNEHPPDKDYNVEAQEKEYIDFGDKGQLEEIEDQQKVTAMVQAQDIEKPDVDVKTHFEQSDQQQDEDYTLRSKGEEDTVDGDKSLLKQSEELQEEAGFFLALEEDINHVEDRKLIKQSEHLQEIANIIKAQEEKPLYVDVDDNNKLQQSHQQSDTADFVQEQQEKPCDVEQKSQLEQSHQQEQEKENNDNEDYRHIEQSNQLQEFVDIVHEQENSDVGDKFKLEQSKQQAVIAYTNKDQEEDKTDDEDKSQLEQGEQLSEIADIFQMQEVGSNDIEEKIQIEKRENISEITEIVLVQEIKPAVIKDTSQLEECEQQSKITEIVQEKIVESSDIGSRRHLDHIELQKETADIVRRREVETFYFEDINQLQKRQNQVEKVDIVRTHVEENIDNAETSHTKQREDENNAADVVQLQEIEQFATENKSQTEQNEYKPGIPNVGKAFEEDYSDIKGRSQLKESEQQSDKAEEGQAIEPTNNDDTSQIMQGEKQSKIADIVEAQYEKPSDITDKMILEECEQQTERAVIVQVNVDKQSDFKDISQYDHNEHQVDGANIVSMEMVEHLDIEDTSHFERNEHRENIANIDQGEELELSEISNKSEFGLSELRAELPDTLKEEDLEHKGQGEDSMWQSKRMELKDFKITNQIEQNEEQEKPSDVQSHFVERERAERKLEDKVESYQDEVDDEDKVELKSVDKTQKPMSQTFDKESNSQNLQNRHQQMLAGNKENGQKLEPYSYEDESDDNSESIDDAGQYHPELYEKLTLPVRHDIEVHSSLENVEIDSTTDYKFEMIEHKIDIKGKYQEKNNPCMQKEHNENADEQKQMPDQWQMQTMSGTYTKHMVYRSDEDSDDIDDSGQYHPELYVKQPELDCHVIVSNLPHIGVTKQNETESIDYQLCQPDKQAYIEPEENFHNRKVSTSKKKQTRKLRDNYPDRKSQQFVYSSDSDSDDIYDSGLYHPELYTQSTVLVVPNDKCENIDSDSKLISLRLEAADEGTVPVGELFEFEHRIKAEGTDAESETDPNISKPEVNGDDSENINERKEIIVAKDEDTREKQDISAERDANLDENKRIPIEVSVTINNMTMKTKKSQEVKKKLKANTSHEAADITKTDIHRSSKKSDKEGCEITTNKILEYTNQTKEKTKERRHEKRSDECKSADMHPYDVGNDAKPSQSQQIKDKNTKDKKQRDEKHMHMSEQIVDSDKKISADVQGKSMKQRKDTCKAHDSKKKAKARILDQDNSENKTTATHSDSKRVSTGQDSKITESQATEKKAKESDKISSIKTDLLYGNKDEHANIQSEKPDSAGHLAKRANHKKKKERGNLISNSEENMLTKSHSESIGVHAEQMKAVEDKEIKSKSHECSDKKCCKEVQSDVVKPVIQSSDLQQQDEQIIRRRSVDVSHYGEISGLSAVNIDAEEDTDVDPSAVSQKLEKWLQEKRDISIRKETERFIKGGLPEEKLQIRQRVQATSNEQRRQRSREDHQERTGRSRHNSSEMQYRRSRRSSQEQIRSTPDGSYGRSRHNSQEGIYVKSRRSSQEGPYRSSRQNSTEGLYERSRRNSQEGKLTRSRHSSQEDGLNKSLRDYSNFNSPDGRYSRIRQSSHDEINERWRNRYQDEGMHERNRYSSENERYMRSRQNSVDLLHRHVGDTVKYNSEANNRGEIPKRNDINERSKQDSREDSIDTKYTKKDEYQHRHEEDIYDFNEGQKNNRRDVFEKCRQCSHDDLYERKELSRLSSPDIVHERSDKSPKSPVFDEELLEGRLGRKADYIEVRKFKRENKNVDKRRANFLTSAQLRIFCEPKKSDKPILGPIEMVSVSYERQKSKENERRALENKSSFDINKITEEEDSFSSILQPKTFDVYRYEKHHKRSKKSNLKLDRVDGKDDQYCDYRGRLNESGFSHKDWEHCQIHNRNVQATDIGYSELYHVDQYSKNRCAKKHDASVATKVVTASANQDNGDAFYSSNPDYVHARSKYQQNLGGQKYPKNSDGPKDKSRMKIPGGSGDASKDGPLSLTDTFSPMDRGQNDNHNMSNPNLSQSAGRLSDSTTSLNNRQAPAKSPSRQNTLQKQTSIQSNLSELNGERRDDPHGIKFERLKNLEEDELLAKIKEIIGHLEKLEDYHRGDGMRIQKMLGDMYWDYTHLREMIADCLAENGYAVVSMKMLKTLNSIGIFKNDDVWFPTYYTYNTMWNFSDASSNLARTLSENDAVRLLTLNCGHKPYINALHSKNVFYVIKASLSILHNMARNSGMKHLFDENKTSETIMPFMDSEDEMLKILATLTIANIVDEEENKTVIAETGTIHCMVSWIEKAISLPRRRFKGFTPQELTEGLNKLAVNDSNKMRIVEEGAVPLFLLMLQHDDVREQSSAGRIIWTLSFDKFVRQKLIENTDLISTLEKLTESTNKSVQQNGNGALWIIKGENDISRETKPKGTPTKSHVFLSYSWSDKDTVLQIRDKLRAEGYAIWIDIEKGTGASLEGMANAIENSAVVLICMSEKYKQNPNCRTEAEYTFQLKKDYIPLMLQKKYRPDGWLGFILGAKLYFDFSGKYPFDKSLTGLLKELRGRGQVTPNTTPVGSNETSDGAMVTSQSLTSYASPGTPVPSNSVLLTMGQEELVKWLRNVKLTECIPAFLEFDGKLLMQLKQMRVEAPEFFYQCLEKRLNMSLIEILKFTRALEELH